MFTRYFSPILNLCRLAVLVVFLVSVNHVRHEKPPWKSSWAKHVAEGREPTFREHLAAGFWYGAAARVGACGALLLVSLGWGWQRKEGDLPPRFDLSRTDDAVISAKAFTGLLAVIFVGALAMRLPRMNHCMWGDESSAMETYTLGCYKPVEPGKLNGLMRFDPPTWVDTFWSARQGPNNHPLFSTTSRLSLEIWRKITGLPADAFSEWVARIPVFICGMASLVVFALLLRKWGAPRIGLLATAILALHPWHIRYSTEARGYGPMLLLFPLTFLVLTYALESNRWRHWLLFGLVEFLTMYAWSGIGYGMAGINVAAAILMLARSDRWSMLVRWATANLLAAAVFLSLYGPQIPQIMRAHVRLGWMKGLPMDATWFHNILATPLTGIPFHGDDLANRFEMSWQGLLQHSPLITGVGFAILIIASVVGLVSLWRRSRPLAALITGVFVSTVVCVLHFYFGIQDELRTWYLIFNIPWLSVCVAVGIYAIANTLPERFRSATVAGLFLLAMASLWPMNASLVSRPEEDFRSAAAVSRDKHEVFSPDKPSKVVTCWLWRYSVHYDPRGDSHTRTALTLQAKMEEAKAIKDGELYVVVGYSSLARTLNADMMALLENPALFEKHPPFYGRESIHTLTVYRMK